MPHDSAPWPAIGVEAQTWPAASAMERPFTYDSALPHEIAGLTPQPTPATSAVSAEAAVRLTRLDAELGDRVSQFAPLLLRSEAVSSSQIENITASARSVLSAELGIKAGRNALVIAGQTRSLRAALALSDDITPAGILSMHAALMDHQSTHPDGQWRSEPVWIGTSSRSPRGAEFVAPSHDRIPALVDDLCRFIARSDIAPLELAAVAHAQFETIHPFTDGNGRTGRALVQAILRNRGVTRNVAIPVSAGILAAVELYHAALTAYRNGDVTPIIGVFADAAHNAVDNTYQLVGDIDAARERWERTLTVRRSSNAWRLLDIIARRPVIDAEAAASELSVAVRNVYPPLKALTDAGILKDKHEHRIGTVWRSEDILAALDAFAERAGRRNWN